MVRFPFSFVIGMAGLIAVVVSLAALVSCSGMSYEGGHFAWQVSDDGGRDAAVVGIDYESRQVLPPRPPNPSEIESGSGLVAGGFELITLDGDGYLVSPADSPFSLEISDTEDGNRVAVVATDADGIASALFCLKYDAVKVAPKSMTNSGFLGDPSSGESISLFVSRAGEVHAGIARVLPDVNGTISGDGVVAEIEFARGAFREPAKNPYANASNEYNKVTDLEGVKTDAGITLSWTERNVGDYDNNGEVGVPDITPIAMHYLHVKDLGGNWPDAADAIIDGDGNGEIGIADITPIATNYLNFISGYNVYRVVDTGAPDFTGVSPLVNPINPSAGSSVVRDDILAGSDPPDTALIYSFTDSTIVPGVHYGYVVRPVSNPADTPSEGLDSNYAVPEFGAEFQLQTDKATYNMGEQIVLSVYLVEPADLFSANCRFDFDPSLVSVAAAGIVASTDVDHPNLFADPVFFGVQVDADTIAFNDTQKKGVEGLTSTGGVLAYVVFDTIAVGDAEFFIHDPSDFVWLRNPILDFSSNKLPHGVLHIPTNPLVVNIAIPAS